jgi:hypothetical protein
MCVAGTSVFLKEGFEAFKNPIYEFERKGAENLGLTYNEASNDCESDMLFMTMSNAKAVDMLRAVAAGDETKFYEIYKHVDDED